MQSTLIYGVYCIICKPWFKSFILLVPYFDNLLLVEKKKQKKWIVKIKLFNLAQQ